MKIRLLITAFTLFCFSACYYDKEDLLYGQSSCDTSSVKYSVQIKNILKASCLSCHSGTAAAGAGIKLDDYVSVKKSADNGSLLSSVTRTVNPMPKGAARLSSCRIAEIRTWIQNGAPNN
jgi:mono/diheme cytochrome c family protein